MKYGIILCPKLWIEGLDGIEADSPEEAIEKALLNPCVASLVREIQKLTGKPPNGEPVCVTSYDIREAAIKHEDDRELDERRVFEWDGGWHERRD